jgi:hypothetical protein
MFCRFNSAKNFLKRSQRKPPSAGYTDSRYHYAPLNENAKEIRLLTLLPGEFHSEIEIRLHKTILAAENIPEFEALSYTWGSTENPVNIKVGSSGNILVTQNLAIALPHLRYVNVPRVLWIDAICVNQQNLQERSEQVQRMSDVYRLAQKAIVWLGPEENDSAYGMEVLNSLGSKINVDWVKRVITKPAGSKEPDSEDFDMTMKPRYGDREILALKFLFFRSWFERLWIWQEIRLASDAIIVAGLNTIPWESFRKAIFCLFYKPRNVSGLQDEERKDFNSRLDLIFAICKVERNTTFEMLVRSTRTSRCTDPKDRVYAMLNILPTSQRGVQITPNYNNTLGQVYQDAFLSFFRHTKQLTLLACCELKLDRLDMPSWVPDWSTGTSTTPLPREFADTISLSDAEYLGHGVLRATGVYTATVAHVSTCGFSIGTGSRLRNIRELQRLAPPHVAEGSYITGITTMEAYCRSLCSNDFGERFVPPNPGFPELYQILGDFRTLLESKNNLILEESSFGINWYLKRIAEFCDGRSFFQTEEGYFGIGPACVRDGDILSVILGCRNPLLLRRNDSNEYAVVGECYVIGLMDGEALLGPLPRQFRRVSKLSGRYQRAWMNTETQKIQWNDPRFRTRMLRDEDGNSIKAYIYQPGPNRLYKAAFFEARGTFIQKFNLV